MSIHGRLRADIAAGCFALCGASFPLLLLLPNVFYGITRPTHAVPQSGFVAPVRVAGGYVYVTPAEAVGVDLLGVSFGFGLLLGLVVVPKSFERRIASSPTGLKTYFVRITDLGKPSPRQKKILLTAAMLYLAIVYFEGARIAEFALAHGISP